MSKYKLKNSIFFILWEGIKVYFSNIDKFLLYMLFPVFGQVIGIALSFGLSLGFADKVVQKADSPAVALLMILLLAIPGLLIFAKAFWDYMVAYVALNSMTEGAVTTGKVYDLDSHNEVATQRGWKYIGFLIILSVLMSLGSSIFFIIPGFVLWIYFILVFQVFTFEPDLSITDIFKRSFLLVKGNWARTFILMAVLGFFSMYILTEGITVVFDYLNLTASASSIFNFISNLIPLDLVNKILVHANQPIITNEMISKTIFVSVLGMIISGLTLPIRSICWSLWYKNLSDVKGVDAEIVVSKPVRRVSRKSRYEKED
ncbi:unknown [Clostridium sp. CAG:813]|nr:unknown [Clostridium sp. CAG:813]